MVVIAENVESIISSYLQKLDTILKNYPDAEIVVVDNASFDGTVVQVKKILSKISQLRLLVLSKPYSAETALTAGLDNCIGDYVIVCNPITDRPNLVTKLLPFLLKGQDVIFLRFTHYDFLAGDRIVRWLSAVLGHAYHRNIYSHINYSLALSRKAVNALTKVRRKKRYYNYISEAIGFQAITVTYEPLHRHQHLLTKETVFSLVIRLFDASISHSVKPLRLASLVGITASFLNISFLLYVFVVSVVKQNIVEGWVTTSVMMGTMFFILFLILTIISEYLLRILEESRQEPLYFVAEEIDNSIFSVNRQHLNVV